MYPNINVLLDIRVVFFRLLLSDKSQNTMKTECASWKIGWMGSWDQCYCLKRGRNHYSYSHY